jgi:4-aminobutyrate aminotransferase-like enzyme/Ser/Thr protein kinase RdoA (MazF antagonist)
MSLLSQVAIHRPHFTIAEAQDLALEHFGIRASARELASERDQNFHLLTADRREFVLKIASSADRPEELNFQNMAMQRVAAFGCGTPCPTVVPSLSGRDIETAKDPGGRSHGVRLLTWLDGVFFADYRPHSLSLLEEIGSFLGRVDRALAAFPHPAPKRILNWEMRDAAAIIRPRVGLMNNAARRGLIERLLAAFERDVEPVLPQLRTGVIHNDGNDHNILIERPRAGQPAAKIAGIIDFGDMAHTVAAAEPAIAAAYALLGKADPLASAAAVIRGFHREFPLEGKELSILFHLIRTRLAVSVAISAEQQNAEPDKPYLSISESPAWEALEKLVAIPPDLAHYVFRSACGLEPCRAAASISAWIKGNPGSVGPVLETALTPETLLVFDLGIGSTSIADLSLVADTPSFAASLWSQMRRAGAAVGIGRYNEARALYTGPAFAKPMDEMPRQRTVHLGIDLFADPGTPVFAPMDGTVHSFRNNARPQDYGPCIILEHSPGEGSGTFYTLYGHLTEDSLEKLAPGMKILKGQRLAAIGDYPQNGNWPPHLHFQLICDLLEYSGDFPGVADPDGRDVWLSLCPDPNLILRIPAECFPPEPRRSGEILNRRRQKIGPSLSLSYRRPLHIVRGSGQYLFDNGGRRYLDAVNNVPHVGHSHPRVARAAAGQMAVLNTNTRYLHENIVQYAERLTALLPAPLSVCYLVNSGSEANDLALRLARTYTNRRDMVVLEGAYHGNLTSLIEVSPYKFDGPGGKGAQPHIHKAVMPDPYRGPYRRSDPEAGAKYASAVHEAALRAPEGIAAFICESVLSCGGQIVLPDNYLAEAYRHVREIGGVCIADEVQVGFARVGTHFWGFETQGAIPDIVTMGKPIGNGHPLGAVVTTREIADAFANGMEYFNTYGGNPVSCAVGLEVLDIIRDENLQDHSLATGEHFMGRLRRLQDRHALIGDVRGLGLFIGIEMVRERETLEPAAEESSYVVERLKDHGILASTDGPWHNVIKIKPPLPFNAADADYFCASLNRILGETAIACTCCGA